MKRRKQNKGLIDLPGYLTKREARKALKNVGLPLLKKLQQKSHDLKWWQKYVPFLNEKYLQLHEEINELQSMLKNEGLIPRSPNEERQYQKALLKARYQFAKENEQKLKALSQKPKP